MLGDYYKNKRFSKEYLTELAGLLVLFFFGIVISITVGSIVNSKLVPAKAGIVNLSTASLHHNTEDGTRSSDRQHGSPTEGRPSSIDRTAAAAVTVCLVISFGIVIAYCVTENKPRRDTKE